MARDVVIQHEQSNDLQADQRLILLHQVIQEGIRQARHSGSMSSFSREIQKPVNPCQW